MNIKSRTFLRDCVLFSLLFNLGLANAMETPPVELTPTNLTSHFPFILIRTPHKHSQTNEMVFFTVVVVPKDGHKPESFLGKLKVRDQQNKNIVSALIRPSKINAQQFVPRELASSSIAFQFSVSAQYLTMSQFELIESNALIVDNPPTYQFTLINFAETK